MSEHELFTKIVNHVPKNMRISWNRKRDKLTIIVAENIQPIEEKILELTMEKQQYVDDVISLRDELIKECVHPRDSLVSKDDHVLCKFCNKKIRINE